MKNSNPEETQECLICGYSQTFVISEQMNLLERKEGLLCVFCGCSWRDRSLVLQVLKLCGLPANFLHKFQLDFSHPILGIGDSFRVQSALGSRLSYVNTFIDKFPTVDLQAPLKISEILKLLPVPRFLSMCLTWNYR
jgi:hypothetical protein